MELLKDYRPAKEGVIAVEEDECSDLCINPAPDVDTNRVANLHENSIGHIQPEHSALMKRKELPTGKVEVHAMNLAVFREQLYSYRRFGVYSDPNQPEQFIQNTGDLIQTSNSLHQDEILSQKLSVYASSSQAERELSKNIKSKRVKGGESSTGEFLGPWACYEGENEFDKVNQTAEDRKAVLEQAEAARKAQLEAKKKEVEFQPTSQFHGDALHDYKGRSYILPPQDRSYARAEQNYIPKTLVHTYKGHRRQVQVAKFFPKFGHMILSGSYDSEVKLWDVHGDRTCLRTYSGHKNAVRDLSFTNDGMHFLSTGWDNRLNFWDTETGQVVRTFPLESRPFCGQFNPDPTRQYAFLVGDVDKKVTQWDVRSGEAVVTYSDHLGPVNTVTFLENFTKFASTSDDKKVFLWEFGIPIVVKHISDPDMHAMAATDVHPSDKYFVGQSADNKVLCFDVKGGLIRLNKKKKFTGHLCAGHSVQIKFSPDGQFLASGDHEGRVFFWDWKSARVNSVIEAHDKACVSIDWHPAEPSTMLTSSWDNTIRLWNA
jgi:pre-mRNA-processing factor 17